MLDDRYRTVFHGNLRACKHLAFLRKAAVRVGLMAAGVGMLVSWGLVLLAIMAALGGGFDIGWNPLSTFILWTDFLIGVVLVAAGYLLAPSQRGSS